MMVAFGSGICFKHVLILFNQQLLAVAGNEGGLRRSERVGIVANSSFGGFRSWPSWLGSTLLFYHLYGTADGSGWDLQYWYASTSSSGLETI